MDDHSAAKSRVVWLMLEAVACHAVESDPMERGAFQSSLRQLVEGMEQSTSSDETFVLAGEAIKSIEAYNRGVQRALNSQMKELQSIVSIFTRSMLQISKSSAASAATLHQIERQIKKSSQIDDLRALKTQLEQSLEVICEEAAAQERRSDEIGSHLRDAMSRPESAAVMSEVVADFDLVTGLPNFRAAEQALSAAITAGSSTYAVLLSVDRVESIYSRFGPGDGDRILMRFGQHMAQRLAPTDQLFRWHGTGFLALIDRTGPEISVRADVARMVAARLEQEIEVGGRSVLLPVTASWMMMDVADSTLEKISQKLDAFSDGQAGGAQSS